MYTSYFGLKENPFNLTPDPRYLYLSPHHKEAFDYLLYGINERKGFIAITGGIGTGKTTLCRSLLSQLDHSVKTALIFNSFITERELLEIINQEFGIKRDPAVRTKKEYIDKLNGFLLENFSRGGNAVLLIDEAQNLSDTVLEQIRMLSNLETEKEKLIQIVLVGQTELKELLAASSLRQLDERILVRYELRPLDRKDVQGYVEHRLVVAGGRGNLKFTGNALEEIYKYSQGNPRRINSVCDRALLVAYAKDAFTISRGMVNKAIEEIRGDISRKHIIKDWSWRRFASSAMLLLLLVLAAGFAGWSFREHILGIFSSDKKTDALNMRDIPLVTHKPKKQETTLFLDENSSLAGLFDLFNANKKEDGQNIGENQLSLVSFNIDPKYHVMFKKPFRIHVACSMSNSLKSPCYLLIRETTEEGAIAIDSRGKEQQVSRDFILQNWGQKVSWVYPHENGNLLRGMNSPDVQNIQSMLHEIGYFITPTGFYGESTFTEVMKFQKDFGLTADGIVGPRTRALLFQISE